MAKTHTQYVCQNCGRRTPRYFGRCPACGEWNTMVEEVVERQATGGRPAASFYESTPQRLVEISTDGLERLPLPMNEFSRVLGGGVVPGSLILVGGEPGIGKSTLLLQTAAIMAGIAGPVLYVSGEESGRQIKMRADRLSLAPEEVFVVTETNLDRILGHIDEVKPRLLIVDSVQTTYSEALASASGSVSQVRETAARLQMLAKQSGIAVFLVGHVTKEGAIAGPKVLEHIVDTVLYLEGDLYHTYRLLRSVKNRFGATSEVGVFEMRQHGMEEVTNPSEAFLAERMVNSPGSAIAVTMEGTRPLLVEVQALTSTTSFGHPRRTANGVDFNRLLLIIAVLSKRVGLHLTDQDVFANVIGGMRITEPASDLAVAVAIASSVRDLPVPADIAFVGELGLSGELRAVGQLTARLKEVAKLGFRRCVVPRALRQQSETLPAELEVLPARSLHQALDAALTPPK
jgi:DNA repair protein RadA/Sms